MLFTMYPRQQVIKETYSRIMRNRLNKTFAEQADIFNFITDEGRNKVIEEVERKYEDRGNYVVSAINGAKVPDFDNILFRIAQPHLSIQSKGAYIPAFADLRSPKDREVNAEEIKKVVDYFLEEMNIVLKGEFLDDFTYQSLIKNKIT